MTETQIDSRIPLDDYAQLLGAGEIEELRTLAKPLRGRSIEMINSTAVGGGVAEILNRLVPLGEELDLNIRWDVMTGGDDFFAVTKSFHNALHGAPYHTSTRDFEIFLAYNERNRARLPLDAEFTVIHDPAACRADRRAQENWKPLGVAMPHRSVASEPRGLGFSGAVCRALRRVHVFLAGVCPPVAHPAVPLLSGDRSALRKKPRSGTGVHRQCPDALRNRSAAPDPHADFAVRPAQRPPWG